MIQAKVASKGVPLNLLVRDLRYKVGLTQNEFAKRLGVSTIRFQWLKRIKRM